MPLYSTHYTLAQARAKLPEIRERLKTIQELLDQICSSASQSGEPFRIYRGNGKGPVVQSSNPLVTDVQTIVSAIVSDGIQIKDISRGLIDFPHFLNSDQSHEVFLCYELQEDTILFWHEIESGYSGRVRLEDDYAW